VLASPDEVVRALLTYTDWWQPATASVIPVRAARGAEGDGIRPGLLEHLDERTELCRRMALLEPRDRELLFLWYVRQLPVEDIAREIRRSARQCFRLRARAIRLLVEAGEPDAAA
jgi:DNA-directed RNA polymerase specialized sigma24 family protein